MQIPMTPAQAKVKAFIKKYTAENDGVCPSYAEIAAGAGLKSRATVCWTVKCLDARGHIERLPGRHRAIRVLEEKK